jgi:hypothetical protein
MDFTNKNVRIAIILGVLSLVFIAGGILKNIGII